MIRKADELKTENRENMRGGDGTVKIMNFVSKEELYNKGRLFSRITLEPGCSIGWHIHETDSEIFFVECGSPIYNDNGTEVQAQAGDVLICPAGTGHAIKNPGSDRVDLIAVIVYAE